MITALLTGIALIYFAVLLGVYWSQSKPSGNLWYGISLPAHAMDNNELSKLQQNGRASFKRIGILALLALIPLFLLHTYVSLPVLYLFLWGALLFAALQVSFARTHRAFAELKRGNEWFVGEKRILRMDTRLSVSLRSKENKLAWLCFVIPASISLIPFSIHMPEEAAFQPQIAGWLSLGVTLILFAAAFSMRRMKPVVYSADSEINLLLNQTSRRYWFRLWLGIAVFCSTVMTLTAYAASLKDGAAGAIWGIGSILSNVVPVLGIVYVHNRLKKLVSDALAEGEEVFYTDDDEYWMNGTIYNNPDDRSVMVPKRTGMGTTINIGTTAGKRIYYGIIVFTAAILLGTGWITVQAEFSTPSIQTDGSGTVKIQFPMYNYSFGMGNVLELKLVDQLPESRRRANGISTGQAAVGNFILDGFGKTKLYIHKQSPPYIVFRLPGLYVVYNHKEASKTRQIFAELQGR